MIIECYHCEAKVDARELGSHFYVDPEIKVGLYLCPVCESVLVGQSDLVLTRSGESEFTPAQRLWPEPYQPLDLSIPEPVRRSIEDARKCMQSGVFSAAAVMCGRAIEYVTVEKTGEKTLFDGLKEMKATNQIDERLFEWANALRKERNIGAHAVGKETKEQDASDILDFAVAFCEYVYVLTQKYDEYVARKSST